MDTQPLRCHPSAAEPHVARLGAAVRRTPSGRIIASYRLTADMARLKVPAPAKATRTDRLWEHMCFEMFIAGEGSDYRELNFAPSGGWAAYRFDAYRAGMSPIEPFVAPRITVRQTSHKLSIDAELRGLDWLPATATLQWRVGLAAVIESATGSLSWWALTHPADKPDFHAPESWVACLR